MRNTSTTTTITSKENGQDHQWETIEYLTRTLYRQIIEKVHKHIAHGVQVYPRIHAERERIIQRVLAQDCAFRIKVMVDPEKLFPLYPEDPKFVFPGCSEAAIEEFFPLVHEKYLMPYLLYAGFAYHLAGTIDASPDRILNAVYEIPVPVKFPGDNDYKWYGQRVYVLAIDKKKHWVLAHLNIYLYQNKMLPVNGHEYRYIEATVLKNGVVDEEFTGLVKNEWNNHLICKLEENPTMVRILRIKIEHPHFKNADVAEILDHERNRWNAWKVADVNKLLITFFAEHTGYHFKDVSELVSYCEAIGLAGMLMESKDRMQAGRQRQKE